MHLKVNAFLENH